MSASVNQIPENPGPIIGAGTRGDIFEVATPGPMMQDAIRGWTRPIVVGIAKTKPVDGLITETISEFSTTGVLQPMKSRAVSIKPEGQRTWRWFTLHLPVYVPLNLDDTVVIKGVRYRVMGVWNLSDFGFVKYELTQDYQNAAR